MLDVWWLEKIISVVKPPVTSKYTTARLIEANFMEIARNNTWSAEDVDEVAQEEEIECSQELLKSISLSKWPFFCKVYAIAQSTTSEQLFGFYIRAVV